MIIPPVATAPTVYGIETQSSPRKKRRKSVATAPTVYGIETNWHTRLGSNQRQVATAPTVYGIETGILKWKRSPLIIKLQQHLPFTVLKQISNNQIQPL